MTEPADTQLLPCPFCGGKAEITDAEECGPQAYVVACTDPMCLSSSKVIFALKDDVTDQLVESWNKRARSIRRSYDEAEALPKSARSRRPTTSNADEWQLWLEEHASGGGAYLAVQIVEAIEEHQEALAREVYALAEAAAERSSDLALEDTPEGHYSRGIIAEAKGVARAVNAIMPYSRDPAALTRRP